MTLGRSSSLVVGPNRNDDFIDFFNVPSSPDGLDEDILTAPMMSASANLLSPATFAEDVYKMNVDSGASPGLSLPIGALSSDSPESMSQDSSSDSSRQHNRKSSSNSSLSTWARADISTSEGQTGHNRDQLMEGLDGSSFGELTAPSINISEEDLLQSEFYSSASNRSKLDVNTPFSFGQSSQSPQNQQNVSRSPPNQTIQPATTKHTPKRKNIQQEGLNGFDGTSEHTFSSHPSTFASMAPAPFGMIDFSSDSLHDNDISGGLFSNDIKQEPWNSTGGFSGPKSSFPEQATSTSTLASISQRADLSIQRSLMSSAPILTIQQTPLKSRVETQINLDLCLSPLPQGITKLHLPTHTISKPKLLIKPSPEKSPDMLELHTMLVCSSAVENPKILGEALERAKQASIGRLRPQIGDNSDLGPLEGGEVNICTGCIARERKRAARKKVKKVEEEESWAKDEAKRVIVFNTAEIKTWEPLLPTDPDASNPSKMKVGLPMRIACYCRHQNEKLGFRVILTVTDYQDKFVAQVITSSVMITDDHKTHAATSPPSIASDHKPKEAPSAARSQGPDSNHSRLEREERPQPPNVPNSTNYSFGPTSSSAYSMSLGFSPVTSPRTNSSTTPRTLSRQASFSGTSGPSAKKRKSSSGAKVPTDLAMTRLETSMPSQFSSLQSSRTSSRVPSVVTSPYAQAQPSFNSPLDFGVPGKPSAPQSMMGPLTPGSNDMAWIGPSSVSQNLENLFRQPISAPTSAHQSRSTSPSSVGRRNQPVTGNVWDLQTPFSTLPRAPTIHKLIPSEGPKDGGIEVTCLGSGFRQGLEVMFGDILATTTTFWGDSSLVCLLPPATHAGIVNVTFKHERQLGQTTGMGRPPVLFRYVDDTEQQLLRLALSVVGQKMTGQLEDARDIALRIIGHTVNNRTFQGSTSGPSDAPNILDAAALGNLDVESALLKCLDLIDLDDSPNEADLNMSQQSGQTMLHMAASLGYQRFVAALLSRGAIPDSRDKGGFTPMHFAAFRNHPQIIKRLFLKGADPTMRSLKGYLPADVAASDDVWRETANLRHHQRKCSGGSQFSRSRNSSSNSLRQYSRSRNSSSNSLNLAQNHSSPAFFNPADSRQNLDNYGNVSDDEESEYEEEPDTLWMRSRTSSMHASRRAVALSEENLSDSAYAASSDNALALQPSNALTAFTEQLFAQLQFLQQIPTRLPMPNIPAGYQNYLQNTMPRIPFSVPGLNGFGSDRSSRDGEPGDAEESESKWWEMFSSASAAAPPPAYDEIYPGADNDHHLGEKLVSVGNRRLTGTSAFQRTETEISSESSSSEQSSPLKVHIGRKSISSKQQAQLRMARAQKLKAFSSDRKLFFIWVSSN
jgi:hypothetical protein